MSFFDVTLLLCSFPLQFFFGENELLRAPGLNAMLLMMVVVICLWNKGVALLMIEEKDEEHSLDISICV